MSENLSADAARMRLQGRDGPVDPVDVREMVEREGLRPGGERRSNGREPRGRMTGPQNWVKLGDTTLSRGTDSLLVRVSLLMREERASKSAALRCLRCAKTVHCHCRVKLVTVTDDDLHDFERYWMRRNVRFETPREHDGQRMVERNTYFHDATRTYVVSGRLEVIRAMVEDTRVASWSRTVDVRVPWSGTGSAPAAALDRPAYQRFVRESKMPAEALALTRDERFTKDEDALGDTQRIVFLPNGAPCIVLEDGPVETVLEGIRDGKQVRLPYADAQLLKSTIGRRIDYAPPLVRDERKHGQAHNPVRLGGMPSDYRATDSLVEKRKRGKRLKKNERADVRPVVAERFDESKDDHWIWREEQENETGEPTLRKVRAKSEEEFNAEAIERRDQAIESDTSLVASLVATPTPIDKEDVHIVVIEGRYMGDVIDYDEESGLTMRLPNGTVRLVDAEKAQILIDENCILPITRTDARPDAKDATRGYRTRKIVDSDGKERHGIAYYLAKKRNVAYKSDADSLARAKRAIAERPNQFKRD